MKSTNLKIMKRHGINVPNFIIIDKFSDIDLLKLNSDKYAVRSNCDAEDSQNKAYAGYFYTELNVGYNNLKNAITKVKNSYNKLQGYTGSKTVIIQEMIDADYSGVVFTSNPNGLLSEIVINYSIGTGAVVDGTSDSYIAYYNKNDNSIIKNHGFNIDNNVLKDIINNALHIENIFNEPMDIEFAVKDNMVYILQARPITTLNTEHRIILDNSNIVESYPGVSLPLTQDFAKEVYYKVFKSMVYALTNDKKLVEDMDNNLKSMIESYNGTLYYNITNWYNIINILPMSNKLIDIWQNMLGVEDKTVSIDNIKISANTKLNITKNFIKYLRIAPKEMNKLNKWFKHQIINYNKQLNDAKSLTELINLYDKLMTELTDVWYITLINDMYTFIYTSLASNKNKEYISNIKGLESRKPLEALITLYDTYRYFGNKSIEYSESKEDFIRKYGDRCAEELKLETKTYRTNPEMLDSLMENFTYNEYENNKNTYSRNLNVVRARVGIYNREISRLNRSRIYGIAREIMIRIGEIFKNNNIISNIDDIFYLRLHEIRNAKHDMKYIITERKEEYAFYKTLPVANRVIFCNKIVNKKPLDLTEINLLNTSNTLVGISVSSGKVIGKAVIVDNPSNIAIDKDSILVTKSTDPGWVFLIEQCAGIIAEKGSLLSHTAIISREMHKPALVGVKNATSIIKKGDIIELDSDNCKIKIKERYDNEH